MTENRIFVGFRMTPSARNKVDDLAKQRGTDRSEVLRYLLTRGWKAHETAPEKPGPVKHDAPPVEEPDTFAERHARLQKGKRL